MFTKSKTFLYKKENKGYHIYNAILLIWRENYIMISKLKNINGKLVNILVGSIGIILILISLMDFVQDTTQTVLLSIGTSILATAIVTGINAKYLISQSEMISMTEKWGLTKIYTARSQINQYTNKALTRTKKLDICAMGLKGFRDAQDKNIEKRVSEGMKLRILTLDPQNPYLSDIDRKEAVSVGYTKQTIDSLLIWISYLQELQKQPGQVQIKTHMGYPHDFYFAVDDAIFVGPYESKTSQQTITYRYNTHGQGARYYKNYFERLWKKY